MNFISSPEATLNFKHDNIFLYKFETKSFFSIIFWSVGHRSGCFILRECFIRFEHRHLPPPPDYTIAFSPPLHVSLSSTVQGPCPLTREDAICPSFQALYHRLRLDPFFPPVTVSPLQKLGVQIRRTGNEMHGGRAGRPQCLPVSSQRLALSFS